MRRAALVSLMGIGLAGCSLFPTGGGSDTIATDPASHAAPFLAAVPAAVSWPTSLGGLALIGAGIFVWIFLSNRRRALLMIATGIGCAILPPVILELASRLLWPVVVLTSLAGLGGLALAGKWAWEKWHT